MSTTISKLRAVVEATGVDEAGQKMREFGRTVAQTSTTSSQSLGQVAAVLRGDFSGALVGLGAAAGVVTAGVAIGKIAVSMDDMRQRAANVRKELTAYAGGAAAAREATEAMLRATDGGVSKMEAMGMASRLLGMGLATTSAQVYDLSRMAVLLGDKTLSVQDRMANWNAMLANQSIERLDTFGISSGRVRARIEELQAAMPGLAREQAFVNAVLEIGGDKLKDVEAQGVTAATSMDKVGAALANLKQAAADKIHVQIVVEQVADVVNEAADQLAGKSDALLRETTEAVRVAQADLAQAQRQLALALEEGDQGLAERARALITEREAALRDAEGQRVLASAMYETAQAGRVIDDAEREYIKTMQESIPAAYAAAAAVDEHARALQRAAIGRGAYMTQRGKAYLEGREEQRLAEGSRGWQMTQWARPREETSGPDLVDQWVARMATANKTVATRTRDTLGDALTGAARDFETALKGALQEGQRYSVGLLDLRPGGAQGANAPGQNGAFEDIYRLQAFVKDGSWGETAAKYGLDRNTASQRIADFQSGKWDKGVMALIDKGKLTQQIQDAQLGQAMQDALAADLAKAAGAEPKVVKALLGIGGGSDGGGAKLDLGGQLVPSLTSAIDAELLSKGGDLKQRGSAAWDYVETGMIEKASKSTRFTAMVESMVDNALDKYVPPA